LVLLVLTTLSLMCRSTVITLVTAQSTTDTSTARCTPMTIRRPVLARGPITGSPKRITLLLVWRLHLQLCQWLDKFIPSFFVSCGSWLTNRRAITVRSSVQRRRLAARLSRGIEHARLVLIRTLLARQSLMPLPHAYTSPCTVQLHRRVLNLASPFYLLNASCTALHMHRTTPPFALHPLAPLSTWMLVHPSSHHQLMLTVGGNNRTVGRPKVN